MIRILSLFATLVNLSRTCLTRLLVRTNHAYFHYQTQFILKPTHFFDMQSLAIQSLNSIFKFRISQNFSTITIRICRTPYNAYDLQRSLYSPVFVF